MANNQYSENKNIVPCTIPHSGGLLVIPHIQSTDCRGDNDALVCFIGGQCSMFYDIGGKDGINQLSSAIDKYYNSIPHNK